MEGIAQVMQVNEVKGKCGICRVLRSVVSIAEMGLGEVMDQ